MRIGGGAFARLAGNAGWNLADQILSTLSNAALTILVARAVDPLPNNKAVFGAFVAALLVFSLFIAIERAMVGQVLSIRHSHETRMGMRRVSARAFGTILTVALPSGALVVAAGLAFGGELRGPLVAVGIMLAPLLLQDTGRMIFFAQSHARRAAANDALWAVIQFAVTAVLMIRGEADATNLILVWGGAAAVAALAAMIQLKVWPNLTAFPGWIRQHGDLLGYLLPETLTMTGGDRAAFFTVGGMIGEAGVGVLGAARQVLNPLQVVTGAAASFGIPEISRRGSLSPRVRRLVGLGFGGVIAAASVAYTFLVLMLPDAVGLFAFKSVWPDIKAALLPMGLFTAAAGTCAGPFIVVAAMGHAKRTFRLTVLATILTLIAMPVGAWLGDAPGAAWGMFVAKAIEIPFWVVTLFRVAREGPVRTAPDPDDTAVPDLGPEGRGAVPA